MILIEKSKIKLMELLPPLNVSMYLFFCGSTNKTNV